jgi:phytanoyl-CoA dioxygenase PhyH
MQITLADVKKRFDEYGFAKVPAAFPTASATAMREQVWSILIKHGIQATDRTTWRSPLPEACRSELNMLTPKGTFDSAASPGLINAIDHVLGFSHWRKPDHWFSTLVTFPGARTWDIPRKPWHIDFDTRGARLPGLRLLAFIGEVRAHSGGTLVLQNSDRVIHRLVLTGNQFHSSVDLHRLLAGYHPLLRILLSDEQAADRIERLSKGTDIDGSLIRVVELTGSPGDVVIMHPWLLHSAAPNCGGLPRMMLKQSVSSLKGLRFKASQPLTRISQVARRLVMRD